MGQGFVVVPVAGGGSDFDLQTSWSPAVRDAFFASGADGLVANYARGFVGHDLAFVRDLPLRRLNVLARTITDLSPIYSLSDTLADLRVQAGSRTRIDLSLLPKLRGLACSWDQVADTIGFASMIEDLFLGSYDPSDLAPLAHLTALRSLRMKDRPALRSLDGVESLPWLQHLGIYGAPLDDTAALAGLASPVLSELHLASCKRLTSLTDLSDLVGLRQLDVSEGGTVESLTPIAGAHLLERLYVYGSTNIADGDLSPVLGMVQLRDFRMMNRRHYRPSVHDVMVRLGIEH